MLDVLDSKGLEKKCDFLKKVSESVTSFQKIAYERVRAPV